MKNDRRHPSVPILLLATLIALPALAERPAPNGPATAEQLEAAWRAHRELEESSLFRGLPWRSVGPVRQGGRVVDVEGVPGEPYSFYVAYASGGLWRTDNNGGTFEPLFDFQPSIVIGDVALDPQDPDVVWVGTGENNSSRSSYGGMGIFRSADGGRTWQSKGLVAGDRVGRIVVDPRDSNRVYVAVLGRLYTESGTRGVYRTTDGGSTWERVLAGENPRTGFVDLVLDPANPEVLYAAAWERFRRPWDFTEGGEGSGIYKSTDGGDSWTRLAGGFPRGAHVGRIGLAISKSAPQTIYASLDNQEELPEELWDMGDHPLSANRLRTMTKEEFLEQDPEAIEDFVRANDLDTSIDGKKLVKMLEEGELTMDELRAELADANANLFNTNIRGLELWRSDDGGATWRRTHDQPLRDVVYTYGYYFGQIAVDPSDAERVYLEGVPLITSGDGGKTFESVQGRDVHVDYHPIWIDPDHPQRILVGNDGGVDASYDGGKTWFSLDGQPVGQFYAITLDNQKPYNIYGGLQDNGSLKGSSRTDWRAGQTWEFIGGGDGMYVQVDPRDDKTMYVGFQFGFYGRRGPDGRAEVRPRDKLKEPALRYNWMTPIQLSPHVPEVVYFGANQLMRSLDRGETWSAISPDLSRSEQRGDVPFATITTVAESPVTFGLIWAGTDDGYVHVSEDGGVTWRDASDGLPRDRWVSRVEPSRHQRDRIYVALNGYRDDDPTPYLYASDDLGRTWSSIAAGLPAEPINVVREDPIVEDVLYAGTDRGVYVSLDRGATWQALQAELPNVPVHDLAVHRRDRELVAGTHGRSVWVVDVLPVQELVNVRQEAVHLFPLEEVQYRRFWQGRRSPWFYRPEFDPEIKVPVWVKEAGRVELQVLDGDERLLRKLEMEASAGVNTFTWDLLLDPELALPAEQERLAAAEKAGDDGGEKSKKKGKKGKKGKKDDGGDEPQAESTKGRRAKTPWAEAVRLGWPLYVTPGTYTVRAVAGDATSDVELTIKPPRPREPRMKKEEPIRGKKDGDE
ncbi:MAG: glycosyl hydrolase [Acidobacteria bacterium]|nr:MAG: glycosyl hydrolase [Acidobacteriota bacterium]